MKRIVIWLVVLYLAQLIMAGGTRAWSVPVAEASAIYVEYPLPYPGMLPDSPFYFLKVGRDQLLLWLTKDPVQKSFYALLLSDKRLAAGQMLVNNKQVSLGVTTLVKGEDYFWQATDLAVSAKSSGRDISDLVAKLTVAGAKHEEILGKVANLVSGKESLLLARARQNSVQSRKRIMELLLGNRQ